MLAFGAPQAHAAPRGALWAVVQACGLKSRLTGSPWPCLAVDRRGRFAVVPDPKRRRFQVLVTPTTPITGIEDPQLISASAPALWRAAWAARAWLDRRLGRPLAVETLGLAVNSAASRTQDLLHVHVGCLRASVRRLVDVQLGSVGESWAELSTPLSEDHRYRARWLAGDALDTTDPFRLLAADPAVGADRSAWTLAMVAAHRPSGAVGFVLLSHRADPATGDFAAGEELLDHRCASGGGGAARGRGAGVVNAVSTSAPAEVPRPSAPPSPRARTPVG